MRWIGTAGKKIAKGFGQLGRFWQQLLCWLFNTRRRLGRRSWPDYVVFTLEGELVERTPVQPRLYALLPFFQTPVTLESLTRALRQVAGDPDVRGVLFLVKGASLSLAQAQSLAHLFDRFRRWERDFNGTYPGHRPKEIVVYLEQSSNTLYAMAVAADRVVTPPVSDWNVNGLHSEPTFLADTLALLGLQFDAVKIAPWKTAYDRFTQAEMSEADAQQLNWLLDSFYADLVDAIAQGRNLPPEEVAKLIDRAPLLAQDALYAGLIDDLVYEDELPGLLQVGADAGKGEEQKREARLLPYPKARRYLLRRPPARTQSAIGVISLSGLIVPGKSRRFPLELPLLGESTIGSTTVQQIVRAAMKNTRLAAIVLHVDSGGGSAAASDLIWRELALLARLKPLVVYMGNVAASGGYYIATPANHIVAQSATLTGSIGGIAGKPVTTGASTTIQAHRYSFQRGANAGLYTDQTTWQGAQREKIEEQIERIYQIFKERVAEGRNLAYADLDPICSGKVWTGKQALANKLIDEIGDFSVAVETACKLADLPVDGSVPLLHVAANGPHMPVSAKQLVSKEEDEHLIEVISALLRRDWAALLGADRIWLLADGLPRIR